MPRTHTTCRTNYFRVKDLEALRAGLATLPDLELHDDPRRGVAILNRASSGWPCVYHDESSGGFHEVDLPALIAEHLMPEQVAVFMEVGAEGLRELVGEAVAINAEGERASLSLDEIYMRAAELTAVPRTITHAHY